MATWKEHKERIDMLAVLTHADLGYRLDPSKGLLTHHYILKDEFGREVDSLYVSNPASVGKQRYWRRSAGMRDSADVIQLIEENLDNFSMTRGARNKYEAMDRVLSYFSNMPEEDAEKYRSQMVNVPVREREKFNPDNYELYPDEMVVVQKLLADRGMNARTAELFAPSVMVLRDKNSTFKIKNLGFPYTLAGKPYCKDRPREVEGYEIRGYKNKEGKYYKNKAKGTNSTTACWQAYLGKTPGAPITEIHFAESAYDIMAYVQINRNEQNFDNTLYVSLGGSFNDKIVESILAAYPTAKPVLHFDNDMQGHLYDCKFAATMCGKQMTVRQTADGNYLFNVGERAFMIPIEGMSYNKFREGSGLRPKLKVEKAPVRFKDWNEILQAAMHLQPKADKKIANETMAVRYNKQTTNETPATIGNQPKEEQSEAEDRPRGRSF